MKTQQRNIATFIAVLMAGAVSPTAFAGPSGMDDLMGEIVVDHQPEQTGGLASDTLPTVMGSPPLFQRVADDFRLDASAEIGTIVWWGFYDLDNPPAVETMRISVYGARAGDGLPDEAASIAQITTSDFERVMTGRQVAVGVAPFEYRYEYELTQPLSLAADTDYWLEIIQEGDLSTAFRWSFSLADSNGLAFVNPITIDWQESIIIGDTAFQLIAIPEPISACLLVAGILLTKPHRTPKGKST